MEKSKCFLDTNVLLGFKLEDISDSATNINSIAETNNSVSDYTNHVRMGAKAGKRRNKCF